MEALASNFHENVRNLFEPPKHAEYTLNARHSEATIGYWIGTPNRWSVDRAVVERTRYVSPLPFLSLSPPSFSLLISGILFESQ